MPAIFLNPESELWFEALFQTLFGRYAQRIVHPGPEPGCRAPRLVSGSKALGSKGKRGLGYRERLAT